MRRGIAGLMLGAVACGPPLARGESDDGIEIQTVSGPSEDSSGADDSSFTEQPSGHDVPHLAECAPIYQGCAEGEKCVVRPGYGWADARCLPVLGDQTAGEPCTSSEYGTDDCDQTSVCWDLVEVEGALLGTCLAFCTHTPDGLECPAGSHCQSFDLETMYLCVPD